MVENCAFKLTIVEFCRQQSNEHFEKHGAFPVGTAWAWSVYAHEPAYVEKVFGLAKAAYEYNWDAATHSGFLKHLSKYPGGDSMDAHVGADLMRHIGAYKLLVTVDEPDVLPVPFGNFRKALSQAYPGTDFSKSSVESLHGPAEHLANAVFKDPRLEGLLPEGLGVSCLLTSVVRSLKVNALVCHPRPFT